MKADYKNWMPIRFVNRAKFFTFLFLIATVFWMGFSFLHHWKYEKAVLILCCGCLILSTGIYLFTSYLYRAFAYDGKKQLSRKIIEGVADRVTIVPGGVGLDVGCGSGALTIACAKRNPKARMIGVDVWGKMYDDYSKELCENNALAEGVSNVSFQEGDALHLSFADETFDTVTSNYVYHNISGVSQQKLLLETFRVLKKGGNFVIHDLMKSQMGDEDIHSLIGSLKSMGYEKVELINTAEGLFLDKKEAKRMGLGSSKLLMGRK